MQSFWGSIGRSIIYRVPANIVFHCDSQGGQFVEKLGRLVNVETIHKQTIGKLVLRDVDTIVVLANWAQNKIEQEKNDTETYWSYTLHTAYKRDVCYHQRQ